MAKGQLPLSRGGFLCGISVIRKSFGNVIIDIGEELSNLNYVVLVSYVSRNWNDDSQGHDLAIINKTSTSFQIIANNHNDFNDDNGVNWVLYPCI